MDTIGSQNFVRSSEVTVPNLGISGIFLVGVVCVIGLLNFVFRAFLCCTLAGNATQRLVL